MIAFRIPHPCAKSRSANMDKPKAPTTCWPVLGGLWILMVSGVVGQETAQDVERASADSATSHQMEIVLLADVKDHGPAGNGLHDYPLWAKRWASLLGSQEVSEERLLTSADPPRRDSEDAQPCVHVTTAWDWPSPAQFQAADVVVAYCYLDWTAERLDQVRRYLENGKGLVLIHSATWTKPKPSREVASLTGVGGFELFRHGPVRLDMAAPEHPICRGLPETIVLKDDETYWPPTPAIDSVTVLATSVEEVGARGATPKAAQPMIWCYQLGRGRVFGCVPGHQAKTFDDPQFRTLLLRGIAWAAGDRPCRWDALGKTKTKDPQ